MNSREIEKESIANVYWKKLWRELESTTRPHWGAGGDGLVSKCSLYKPEDMSSSTRASVKNLCEGVFL